LVQKSASIANQCALFMQMQMQWLHTHQISMSIWDRYTEAVILASQCKMEA